jgi:hypothetical protein
MNPKTATERRIIKLFKAGKTPRQIRNQLPGVPVSLVAFWRRKLGLPPFRIGRPPRRGLDSKITKLLQAGKTPREIRRLVPGVDSSTISNRRKKLGLPPFPSGRPAGSVNFEVRRIAATLRKEGLTYAQIGEVFGVTRQRAHQYFPETHRIKIRRGE